MKFRAKIREIQTNPENIDEMQVLIRIRPCFSSGPWRTFIIY